MLYNRSGRDFYAHFLALALLQSRLPSVPPPWLFYNHPYLSLFPSLGEAWSTLFGDQARCLWQLLLYNHPYLYSAAEGGGEIFSPPAVGGGGGAGGLGAWVTG